jgi:hypothetical protein
MRLTSRSASISRTMYHHSRDCIVAAGMDFPAPINGIRLATFEDLHRISLVAAAAFFSSPTFRFQRPHYKDFPSDTVASYFAEYRKTIEDATCVVLVAEDILEEDEDEQVYKALRYTYNVDVPNKKGIVGVCSFRLKPGSLYQSVSSCKHVCQHCRAKYAFDPRHD